MKKIDGHMWNVRAAPSTSASDTTAPIKKKRAVAVTIDQVIEARRCKITQERTDVPLLQNEVDALRSRASTLVHRYQVRERADVLTRISDLEREIVVRKSRVREYEFGNYAAKYMEKYYDNTHVQSNRSDDTSRIITAPGHTVETANHHITIASAREAKRQAVINEFMTNVDQEPAKINVRARDECPFCTGASLLLNAQKSILVCNNCGYTLPYLDSTTQSMSYTDDYDFSTFSYKRQSHFDDILKLVQGKETMVVGDDVIEAVMRELYAHRYKKEDITQHVVRQILRKLRLRRSYDHVSQLTMRITGTRSPRISSDMEDKCRHMFIQMSKPFERYCPKNRKNFLSYNYVLFRCFHILGLNHMLGTVSLLKGREKLLLQDETFEKIADHLGWPFVPIDQVIAEHKLSIL